MPTGIRCSIYLRNKEEYEVLKRAAKDDGRSVSNYLIRLHEINIGKADLGTAFVNSEEQPKKLYE